MIPTHDFGFLKHASEGGDNTDCTKPVIDFKWLGRPKKVE